MNTEFIIDINGFQAKLYMQIGFFNHKDLSFPLHKHPISEIHVLLSGSAVLECEKGEIVVQEGDAICMPANMLHTYRSFDKDSKRITFFIDCNKHPITTTKITFPPSALSLLCKEIEEYVLTGKDSKLKALLSYICSDFFITEDKKPLSHITNRELIIDDFFRKKYNSNAKLDDLAQELMLSPKQTERELKRITGNTFVGELSKRKIEAAIVLSQTTNIPLTKISEMVGFVSYSGFYKAYKKYIRNFSNVSY